MMLQKKFQKRVEDFSCEECGFLVHGNGYTNHCPKCLWSRHVDIAPGDRMARCGGLMKPVSAFLEGGEWKLIHRCLVCDHEKKNRLGDGDDMNMLGRIVSGIV